MVTSKEKETLDGNNHISNNMSSHKFQQERERWQYIGTQKNNTSEPRVKKKNEDG